MARSLADIVHRKNNLMRKARVEIGKGLSQSNLSSSRSTSGRLPPERETALKLPLQLTRK